MTLSKKKTKVELKIVSKSDYQFLYHLLMERDSNVNISHKKMPTYKQHLKFVMSKPYTKWYIIKYYGIKSGSIYLTKQDEIGIFLKKESKKKGVGKLALKLLIQKNKRPRYLANINPKNTTSIKFFKKNGFNLIQYTYELMN